MPGIVIGGAGHYVGEGWIGSGDAASGFTTISPPLFTNTNSFFGPKVNGTLKPALLSNTSVINSPAGSPVSPTVVSTNAAANTLVSSPKTVTLPTGSASGDIILVFFVTSGGNSPTFPAGWTKIYSVAGTTIGHAVVARRLCDGTEGASISVTIGGGGARAAWASICLRNSPNSGSFSVDDVVVTGRENASSTTNPDPPSLSFPSGGFTHNGDAVASIAAFMAMATTGISSYPTNYTDTQIFSENPAPSPAVGVAVRRFTSGASVDPGTFTTTTAQPEIHELTLSVRARSAGVRHSYRPGLFTNVSTLYAPTLNIQRIAAPALYTNSQTFFAPRIRLTVKPGLFTNTNSLFAPTVAQVKVLFPGLFTNAPTLFAPSVRRTVRPALHTNANTIFGPSVRRTVAPGLFTNSQTFYGPRLRLTVRLGGVVASGNVFYGPTIAADGSVSPPLYLNTNSFLSPVVSVASPGVTPTAGAVVSGGPGPLNVRFDYRKKPRKKGPVWPNLPKLEEVPEAPPFLPVVVQPGLLSALAREQVRWKKAHDRRQMAKRAIAQADRIVDAMIDEEVIRILADVIAKE